jgi:beta-lactamase class D
MKFNIFFLLCLIEIFSPTVSFPQLNNLIPVNNATIVNSNYRSELKKIYDEFEVDGMLVLYSEKSKKYFFYDSAFYNQPMSPASTFNILLALIGIQEGIISEKNSVLKPNEETFEHAFKNNIDSYFRNLSLIIGQKKIQYWLNKISYGTKTISGEKARFWINGLLQITPEQQLKFIERFYYEDLPFSSKAFGIVKSLMDEDRKIELGVKIFGKRGSNKVYQKNKYTNGLYNKNKYVGWFVGYIEDKTDVWLFVNYVESPNLNNKKIVNAQKEVVFKFMKKII